MAFAGGLLSTELVSQVFEEPDESLRHGTSLCGCPCLSRIGVAVPYVVQVDYATGGCIPTSGYLPTALTSDAVVDYDGSSSTVTWSGLLLGLEHEVSGPLTAEVEREGEVLQLQLSGALAMGTEQVDFDLSVVADAEQIRMGGRALRAGEPESVLTLQDIELPYLDFEALCPKAAAGSVSMESRGTETVVSFEGGEVRLHRKRRASSAVDWCAFIPGLL